MIYKHLWICLSVLVLAIFHDILQSIKVPTYETAMVVRLFLRQTSKCGTVCIPKIGFPKMSTVIKYYLLHTAKQHQRTVTNPYWLNIYGFFALCDSSHVFRPNIALMAIKVSLYLDLQVVWLVINNYAFSSMTNLKCMTNQSRSLKLHPTKNYRFILQKQLEYTYYNNMCINITYNITREWNAGMVQNITIYVHKSTTSHQQCQ